jgi:hypothetical protein
VNLNCPPKKLHGELKNKENLGKDFLVHTKRKPLNMTLGNLTLWYKDRFNKDIRGLTNRSDK